MKISYDPKHNIAYIRFKGKSSEVETIRISDELVIDMAPDGAVYGIELLNATKQLKYEDMGKLFVINEASGKSMEVPLSFD